MVGTCFTLFTCGVRQVYAQVKFPFLLRQCFGAFVVTNYGLSSFQLDMGRRNVYSSEMRLQHSLVVNLSCMLFSPLRLQLRPLQMNSTVWPRINCHLTHRSEKSCLTRMTQSRLLYKKNILIHWFFLGLLNISFIRKTFHSGSSFEIWICSIRLWKQAWDKIWVKTASHMKCMWS